MALPPKREPPGPPKRIPSRASTDKMPTPEEAKKYTQETGEMHPYYVKRMKRYHDKTW